LGPREEGVEALAARIGADPADCWPILAHLAANDRVQAVHGRDPRAARFRARG